MCGYLSYNMSCRSARCNGPVYNISIKVSEGAKIRNQYNQVPHLTQNTNGKVIKSQLDTTNESQEVSLFPAGDHKAHKTDAYKGIAYARQKKNIKDPQKKYRLGTVSNNILLEGLNRLYGAPTSPLIQMWIKTHRYLICTKDA